MERVLAGGSWPRMTLNIWAIMSVKIICSMGVYQRHGFSEGKGDVDEEYMHGRA